MASMARDETAGLPRRRIQWLAWAGVAGVVLFNVGWLVAGRVQGPPYSAALHDISDLGALSARSPWLMLVPEAAAGLLTIAFALGGLRPAMMVSGRGQPLGAWMVALSLMGLDNVSDLFFRLPCSSAEPGCTLAVATASWQGALHYAFGIGTALVTVATPFVLARRMKIMDEWRDLAGGANGFGAVLVMMLILYIGLDGRYGQGYVQRGMALTVAAGIVILAGRLRRISAGARGAGA